MGFLSAVSTIVLSLPVFPSARVEEGWLNEKLGKICADPGEILPAPTRSDQSDLTSTIDQVTCTAISVRGPDVR